jgi:hypothetical protein
MHFPCFCIQQNYDAAKISQTIAIAGEWTKAKEFFCSNDHVVPFYNTLYIQSNMEYQMINLP